MTLCRFTNAEKQKRGLLCLFDRFMQCIDIGIETRFINLIEFLILPFCGKCRKRPFKFLQHFLPIGFVTVQLQVKSHRVQHYQIALLRLQGSHLTDKKNFFPCSEKLGNNICDSLRFASSRWTFNTKLRPFLTPQSVKNLRPSRDKNRRLGTWSTSSGLNSPFSSS